jgi:hypothetical protein
VTIRAKYKTLNYNKIRQKKTLKMISCTTLQHHCAAFGFASGYTEVLQGGTISMPTEPCDELSIKKGPDCDYGYL